MGNNNVINGPEYYMLKDGTFLEDALWDVEPNMDGPTWDACIYKYRAGHKDGEPFEKDMGKVQHYAEFWARVNGFDESDFYLRIGGILNKVFERHGNRWENDND